MQVINLISSDDSNDDITQEIWMDNKNGSSPLRDNIKDLDMLSSPPIDLTLSNSAKKQSKKKKATQLHLKNELKPAVLMSTTESMNDLFSSRDPIRALLNRSISEEEEDNSNNFLRIQDSEQTKINGPKSCHVDQTAKKKKEKEENKLRNQLEKAKKQEEISRQKEGRLLMKEVYRKRSVAEALEEIIVVLDESFTCQKLVGKKKEIRESEAIQARFESELIKNTIHKLPLSDTFIFKRIKLFEKVNAENEKIMIAPSIVEENVVIMKMTATTLIEMITHQQIDAHFSKFAKCFARRIHICIIEGLNPHYQKYKSGKNRVFSEQVRALFQDNGNDCNNMAHDNRDDLNREEDAPPLLNKDHIEVELLRLQLQNRCHFIHTNTLKGSIDSIIAITRGVAMSTYKLQEEAQSSNFCVEMSGRTAATNTEAWQKLLQQISGVTSFVAESIVRVYPTLRALVDAYANLSLIHGEVVLADIMVDRGTANAGRRLGPAISKKIYTALTSNDPNIFIH